MPAGYTYDCECRPTTEDGVPGVTFDGEHNIGHLLPRASNPREAWLAFHGREPTSRSHDIGDAFILGILQR